MPYEKAIRVTQFHVSEVHDFSPEVTGGPVQGLEVSVRFILNDNGNTAMAEVIEGMVEYLKRNATTHDQDPTTDAEADGSGEGTTGPEAEAEETAAEPEAAAGGEDEDADGVAGNEGTSAEISDVDLSKAFTEAAGILGPAKTQQIAQEYLPAGRKRATAKNVPQEKRRALLDKFSAAIEKASEVEPPAEPEPEKPKPARRRRTS